MKNSVRAAKIDMKKTTLTVLTLIFSIAYSFSQDVITKKTAEDIQVKVLEVTNTEIKYKRFDNLNGPIFTIAKSDILRIIYENGTKDIFNEKDNSPKTAEIKNDLLVQGRLDASNYYKSYKHAGTGTLVVSLLSPLVGLIPAVVCSSTDPKDSNLDYPNAEIMKDAAYNKGYTEKAKKIKQGKVWKNWAIALGVNIIAVLVITAGQ